MDLLKQRILKDGTVKAGGILKVDSFLNHQIDIELLNEIGKEFAAIFEGCSINKILTIEASGIGIACMTAQYLKAPVVFAKKAQTLNMDGEVYQTPVFSFTHDKQYNIMVTKKYLTSADHVLIIDDFLAKGNALVGLIELVKQSGATLCGSGIVIEKGFQGGGDMLRAQGVRVESLAIIDSMEQGSVLFRG